VLEKSHSLQQLFEPFLQALKRYQLVKLSVRLQDQAYLIPLAYLRMHQHQRELAHVMKIISATEKKASRSALNDQLINQTSQSIDLEFDEAYSSQPWPEAFLDRVMNLQQK